MRQTFDVVRQALPWQALFFLALGLALVLAGILGIDRVIAETTDRSPVGSELLDFVVDMLDMLTFKWISNNFLGPMLIVIALSFNAMRHRDFFRGGLLYVGICQTIGTLVAELAKPIFGRARPFQTSGEAGWIDTWFAGSAYSSFPSGHVAFYTCLCLPVALWRPRLAAAVMLVPLVVAVQRMVSHVHYASDVGASMILATIISLAARPWFLQEDSQSFVG